MTRAYYNEVDPFAAQWLRNLIVCGYIAPGDVDERDIRDVYPSDLKGYVQCHFFAGIGIWSRAFRSAGWADERPVWSGSCPCQPFSAAGRREGIADERHLWPHFHHLIRECKPGVVFGEQVASKDGLAWLDLVQSDLEGEGYAVGALDLCAAGVGAPHIRQRLYWAADAYNPRPQGRGVGGDGSDEWVTRAPSVVGGVADAYGQGDSGGRIQRPGESDASGAWAACERSAGFRATGRVVLADGRGRQEGRTAGAPTGHGRAAVAAGGVDRPGPTNGGWADADWLFCRDNKWRPVKSGTFPLVDGYPSRVGALRAYGNAVVAPLAEEFIRAYLGT